MASATSSPDPMHHSSPAEDIKHSAKAALDQQKDAAASGLGEFAQVLRRAAGDTGGAREAGVGRIADVAADQLERFSGTLRSKDLNSLVRDVETFAREQPVAFFGAAVAAGFLAVRFARSSQRSPDNNR
jgi:hypothetical protein